MWGVVHASFHQGMCPPILCAVCRVPCVGPLCLWRRTGRACGLVVCATCSPGSVSIPSNHWTSGVTTEAPVGGVSSSAPQPVCLYCFAKFAQGPASAVV